MARLLTYVVALLLRLRVGRVERFFDEKSEQRFYGRDGGRDDTGVAFHTGERRLAGSGRTPGLGGRISHTKSRLLRVPSPLLIGLVSELKTDPCISLQRKSPVFP